MIKTTYRVTVYDPTTERTATHIIEDANDVKDLGDRWLFYSKKTQIYYIFGSDEILRFTIEGSY